MMLDFPKSTDKKETVDYFFQGVYLSDLNQSRYRAN